MHWANLHFLLLQLSILKCSVTLSAMLIYYGTFPGKSTHSMSPWSVCALMHSLRNREVELEVCRQLQGHNLIGIRERWWDSSQNQSSVMDGYRPFRDDGPGRWRGEVALCTREERECTHLWQARTLFAQPQRGTPRFPSSMDLQPPPGHFALSQGLCWSRGNCSLYTVMNFIYLIPSHVNLRSRNVCFTYK